MASERAVQAVLGLEMAVAAVVRGEADEVEEAHAERALLTYIESLERDHAAMERLRDGEVGQVFYGGLRAGNHDRKKWHAEHQFDACVSAADPADAILGGRDGDSG